MGTILHHLPTLFLPKYMHSGTVGNSAELGRASVKHIHAWNILNSISLETFLVSSCTNSMIQLNTGPQNHLGQHEEGCENKGLGETMF